MHPREKAAIAATLSDAGLLDRVRAVAGREVGDPLNNPHDSVKLREQFDLTVEFTHSTVFAFNDVGVCAALEKLRAENAALKHDLQYARDGLAKGRARMREDNERLRETLREVLQSNVGQQTLAQLADGQGTATEEGKAWLAAAALVLGPNVRTEPATTAARKDEDAPE